MKGEKGRLVNRRARHASWLEQAADQRRVIHLVAKFGAAAFIDAGARSAAWQALRAAQTIRRCYGLGSLPR